MSCGYRRLLGDARLGFGKDIPLSQSDAEGGSMSDPHTVLQLTDVTRVFGGTPVLSGVTLSVPGQACVGIRGASGAGKSTLARIVAGVDLGFEGTVTGDATRSHLVYQ